MGELWQPTGPWPGPPWRDLDGRAKRRRVGRVLGTVAAITVALGLFSQVVTPSSPSDEQDDTISQQSEQTPLGWPATSGITTPPPG